MALNLNLNLNFLGEIASMGFFLFGIQLVLIAFKLYGIFDFSWWVIFLPSLVVCLLFVFAAFDNECKMGKDFDDRFKEIEERAAQNLRELEMFEDKCMQYVYDNSNIRGECRTCFRNERLKEIEERVNRSMKDRDFIMYGDECMKCGSYKPFSNVHCKYCIKIEAQNDAIKELKCEIEKLKLRVRCLENCVYR
jgi:hypothetical protein